MHLHWSRIHRIRTSNFLQLMPESLIRKHVLRRIVERVLCQLCKITRECDGIFSNAPTSLVSTVPHYVNRCDHQVEPHVIHQMALSTHRLMLTVSLSLVTCCMDRSLSVGKKQVRNIQTTFTQGSYKKPYIKMIKQMDS